MNASHSRKIAALLSICLGVGLNFGCDSNSDPSSSQLSSPDNSQPEEITKDEQSSNGAAPFRIVRDEGTMPEHDTVLAKGASIVVTLADFDESMRRSMLFAPQMPDGQVPSEVPPERLATPHLHTTVINSLVSRAIVLEEASKRQIEVHDKELLQFVSDHPVFSLYAPLFRNAESDADALTRLQSRGLTIDELRLMVREEVLKEKLRVQLLDAIDDAQLWEHYKRLHDTVNLAIIHTLNTPTSQEIDDYIQVDRNREAPLIDAHFRENQHRYMSPGMVELTMLKPAPSTPDDELEALLTQATHRLSSGESPQAVASGLGLTLDETAHLVAEENRRAFHSQVGATGFELSGPRGAYAWLVRNITARQPMELNRALRREIAASLLRTDTALPSVREKLRPGLELLNALAIPDGEELSEEQRRQLRRDVRQHPQLTLIITGHFPHSTQGYIPQIGLAEALMQKAFELSPSNPTTSEAIVSRGRAHVFRIVGRKHPSRAQFEQDKEEFRAHYLQQQHDEILHRFIMKRHAEYGISIDTTPLRIKYGVIQKQP